MTQAIPIHPYDPHILAAKLSELFELPLTAHMISRDGVEFETGAGDRGYLRVTLQKGILISEAHRLFQAARIPSDDEVRHEALESELRAARQELAELKAQIGTSVTGES